MFLITLVLVINHNLVCCFKFSSCILLHFSKQEFGNSDFPRMERNINLIMLIQVEFPQDVLSRLILGQFCLHTLCSPPVYFPCVLIYLMDLDQHRFVVHGTDFFIYFRGRMRLHSLFFGSQKSNLAAIQSEISVFNLIESQRVLCVPALMQLQNHNSYFLLVSKQVFTGQIQRC